MRATCCGVFCGAAMRSFWAGHGGFDLVFGWFCRDLWGSFGRASPSGCLVNASMGCGAGAPLGRCRDRQEIGSGVRPGETAKERTQHIICGSDFGGRECRRAHAACVFMHFRTGSLCRAPLVSAGPPADGGFIDPRRRGSTGGNPGACLWPSAAPLLTPASPECLRLVQQQAWATQEACNPHGRSLT